MIMEQRLQAISLFNAQVLVFAVTGLIDLITTLSVSGKIKRWTIEQIAFDADRDIEDEIIEDGDDD